jgi:putative peptidoglycan lipid II flippase
LIGTAIATVLLPTLSELAARSDWRAFQQTIEKALRMLIALTLPAAAVIAAGIHPLSRAAFGFDAAGTDLLTLTTRVYLITLCGYAVQEIAARAFYARKEAWYPFFAVAIRMAIYIVIAVIALLAFRAVGAPAIAFAELSLTVEAVVMFIWLSRKMHQPLKINSALFKGLLAALIGGALAYGLAVFVPGSAVLTALLGMAVGGTVALLIVWKEARLLMQL